MRIFDCLLYNGEIEALEKRLRELSDIVDVFVVVEATRGFSGVKKPLFLRTQWPIVKAFARKIRYVVVDEDIRGTAQEREEFQRGCTVRGLLDAADDDVIVGSDITEIPQPAILVSLRAQLPKRLPSSIRRRGDRFPRWSVDDQGPSGRSRDRQLPLALSRLRARLSRLLARHPKSAREPIIICPYVVDEHVQRVRQAFGLDEDRGRHLPFFFWKDIEMVGPERAFEHCWRQFPDRDVIIIHTDMAPRPDDNDNAWYQALLEHAAKLPDAGIIACDLLFPHQSEADVWYIQCGGGLFTDSHPHHIGGYVASADNARIYTFQYDATYRRVRPVEWVTFGGVYIRREVLDMVGPFDERYQWAYVMDVDYSLETRLRGLKLYQVPVNLLHEENGTTRPLLADPVFQAKVRGNYQTFCEKWAWYFTRRAALQD